MTLGKKLSQYRKLIGISQQQLGDKLNVSPQAVSKWENDLAEPDLTTLKALAELYRITIDELLDTSADSILTSNSTLNVDAVAQNMHESAQSTKKEEIPSHPIGFCKRCGITVTEENLGEKEPVVTCKKCLEEIQEEKIKAERKKVVDALNAERERKQKILDAKIRKAEIEKKLQEQKDAELKKKQERISKFLKLGCIFGGVAAGAVLILFFSLIIANGNFSGGSLFGGLILTYTVFSFTFLMFFDGAVSDFVLDCFDTTINWPGLIFTFDLDGFLWLIGMKILFAVLGFLAGILASIFGIVVGIVMSVFVFPFKLVKILANRKIGNDDDLYRSESLVY